MKVCVYLPIWSDYGFNWKRLPNHGTLDQEPSTDFVFLCVRLAMPSGTQLSEGCRRILVCRRSWTWTRLMKWMRYHWVGVIIWSCGCGVSPVAGLRTHVWGLLVTTQHLVAMVSKCCPAATNRCVYYSLHTFLIIHSFIFLEWYFSDDFLVHDWSKPRPFGFLACLGQGVAVACRY